MKRMKIFMRRSNELSRKDILITLFTSVVVFSLVAYATRKNVFSIFEATKSNIFSMIMAAVWVGLCATISTWSSEEYHIMPQIKNNLLPVGSYIAGHLCIQLGLSAMQALIGTVIYEAFFDYANTGIVFPHVNIEVWLTLFLVIFASATLGLFVGLLISNIKSAMTVLPLVLIAQLLFSKGIFELENEIERVSNFVVARYGIAALGSIFDINQYPIAIKVKYPQVEQVINDLFQMNTEYILECWIGLVILAFVPIVAAYILLFMKKNKKS